MASDNPQPSTQNISNVGTTTPPNAATANRDIPIDQPSCLADALSNRFCNDCKYGCKETAQKIRIKGDETSTITNAIKTQHNNYEGGNNQYCKEFVLMCHTAGKQYQLRHPQQSDIQKIQPKSMYMSHIASSDTHAAPVCLHCFRALYKISESNWRKVCPSREIQDSWWHNVQSSDESPHYTLATQIFMTMHDHLNSITDGNRNVAIVVDKQALEEYDKVVILHNPKYVPPRKKNNNNTKSIGTIDYSEVTINGIAQSSGDIELNNNMAVGRSIAIAVSKEQLDNCISQSNNKLKVQYTYGGMSSSLDTNTYVLLSACTIVQDKANHFHPNNTDYDLLKTHKANIIPAGGHFNCEGYYAAFGSKASYDKHADGTSETIGLYKSLKEEHDPQFTENVNAVTRIIIASSHALSVASGMEDIVPLSAQTTINNAACGDWLNVFMPIFERHRVVCHPMRVDDMSAIFPSMNICINAKTGTFHTEDDQGYTLWAVPYQNSSRGAKFLFRVNGDITLSINMTPGAALLFNARLLTHRQEYADTSCNKVDECGVYDYIEEFWNIACYANRAFDNFTMVKLRREFDFHMTMLPMLLSDVGVELLEFHLN